MNHIHMQVGKLLTNCYIVYDDTVLHASGIGTVPSRECVVIDPGGEPERIIRILRDNGLTARYIFLTHGHFDHMLALPAVREATGAKVVIHEKDALCLTEPKLAHIPITMRGGFKKPADFIVNDGAEFWAGSYCFKWLHTPGHTPGSSCILSGRSLYTGDTLFEDDCGRCDLQGGDYTQMLSSLRLLAELPGDYAVYPGHDVSTTLERERRVNKNVLEALGA